MLLHRSRCLLIQIAYFAAACAKNNVDVSFVSEISVDYCVSQVEYSGTKRRIIFVLILL